MSDEDKYYEDKIKPLRVALWANIDLAVDHLNSAVSNLARLSNASDVEYEGGPGTEFGKHLQEARRLAVIAKALMPTDAQGEYGDRDNRDEAIRAIMGGSVLGR